MVTLHIVIGVGVFILPLFLLLFTVVAMELAHVYIIIGSISFIASVLTTIVLVTKFINQPAAHGFFSYSDTFARLVFYFVIDNGFQNNFYCFWEMPIFHDVSNTFFQCIDVPWSIVGWNAVLISSQMEFKQPTLLQIQSMFQIFFP